MSEFPIPVPELFYHITNVCNLTCKNCVSYSNLDLKGSEIWEEHYEKNKLWPSLVKPFKIAIFGGEPLLNPDIKNWLKGVRELWPDHDYISLYTNGTLIEKKRYLECIQLAVSLGIHIHFSIHQPGKFEFMQKIAAKILEDLGIEFDVVVDIKHTEKYKPGDEINYSKDSFDHYMDHFVCKTTKKKIVTVSRVYLHQENTIEIQDNKKLTMFFSDQEKAHNNCCLKETHVVIAGEFYKCLPVSTGRALTKSYNIDTRSLNLINSYTPCNPLDDKEKIKNWFYNLPKSMPQCAICPESYKNIVEPL